MPRIRTESDLLPYKHERWRIMEASGMTPDPWQREYQYRSPGQHGEYDLFSLGRDGREGGADEDEDITSW